MRLLVTLAFVVMPPASAEARDVPASEGAEPLRAVLDGGDRPTARNRSYEGELGLFDVSAFASHTRHGRSDEDTLPLASQRHTARNAGFALSTPLFGDVSFRSEAGVTQMKRRLAAPLVGYRARATGIGAIGAGLSIEDGPSLMLDYVRTGPTGRRSPAERMAELAGGAPAAGRGMRLALAGGRNAERSGGFGWSLSGSAMRRPAVDAGLSPGARDFTDTRAEFAVHMGF